MKKLTRTDRIQRRIYIPSKFRRLLPASPVFPMTVSDTIIQVKIDSYGYLTPHDIPWNRFTALLDLDTDDVLIFKQLVNGLVEICNTKD